MTDDTQLTIDGESLDDQLWIQTTGRVLRPFRKLVSPVANEYKIHATPDGLNIRVVDSSNVFMADVTLPTEALDGYETNDTTIGVSDNALGAALSDARYGKSTDDPVTVTADPATLEASVERDFAGHDATVRERAELIDPGMIREEPDLPNLDTEATVDLSPRAFIELADSFDEHVRFSLSDGALCLSEQGDIRARRVDVTVNTDAEMGESIYSQSYLKSIADGLHAGYADALTLRFPGAEMPIIVDFETEYGAHGHYMVAPRITSE